MVTETERIAIARSKSDQVSRIVPQVLSYFDLLVYLLLVKLGSYWVAIGCCSTTVVVFLLQGRT